jgi:hypothetical protein
MANIVVPSDITLLEEKLKVGRRRLTFLENLGLFGMSPVFHIHYSKMDKGDRHAVLSKRYGDDPSEANQLVKKRQAAISKECVAHNFLWAGGWAFAGASWWSFRRYNYQSRLLALPFMFYAGTFAGRVVGDIVTFRNAEFARDRFLGSLPAKVYYAPGSA